jgi:transcriptional regulator
MHPMYVPAAFAEDRPEILAEFIAANAFATLVTNGAGGLVASHIPLLHDAARGTLVGHLARANPQGADLVDGAEAFAIFAGPHAYVSPRWYMKGPAVPTWNYTAVHAYGRVRRVDEPEALARIVTDLTRIYEAGAEKPWRYEDMPETFVRGMLNGIVGFELTITRLEGKWKMSQNRPAEDVQGVIEGLGASGDPREREVGQIVEGRAGGRVRG